MTVRLFAAALTLAVAAAGADTPLPQLRVEPKTGGSIFYVKNVSTHPLTAYAIELVDYPGSSYALWQDESDSEPIAPGKEKRIEVGNMTVGAVPDYVKVRAALYADGATAGIPQKINQLMERRAAALDTVRQTINRLEKAQETHVEKDALLANLKQAALFLVAKGPSDSQFVINRTAGMHVINETIAQLDKKSVEDTLAWLRAMESALAKT